jgi:hypothetical protein
MDMRVRNAPLFAGSSVGLPPAGATVVAAVGMAAPAQG